MATEAIEYLFQPSKNLYALVFNGADQVLDADNSWKSLDTASNPALAMTAVTSRGGVELDLYRVSLDLARVNKALTEKSYTVAIYERLGGSPAPTTDRQIGSRSIAVAVAALSSEKSKITVEVGACNTTTQGNSIAYLVTLRRGEERLNLYSIDTGASVVLSAREHGQPSAHFTSSPATVRSDGDFELLIEATAPATVLAADRLYQHTLTFTVGGETFEHRVPIANFG